MSVIRIVLDQALPAFHPGEKVEGEVQWDLTEELEFIDLNLSWTTEPQLPSEEPEVVDSPRFAVTSPKGSVRFSFVLPEEPWSFEGKLFSVRWSIGLAGYGDTVKTEIVVSPTGQPLRPRT